MNIITASTDKSNLKITINTDIAQQKPIHNIDVVNMMDLLPDPSVFLLISSMMLTRIPNHNCCITSDLAVTFPLATHRSFRVNYPRITNLTI